MSGSGAMFSLHFFLYFCKMQKMNRVIYKILILILLFTFQTSVYGALDFSRVGQNVTNLFFSDVNTSEPKEKKEKKEKKKKDKPENRNLRSTKRVTFETYEYNYQRAVEYYKNGQYLSAARIFEELYPLSLGTPRADSILYMFADCYYQNQDYTLAAFHFKDYARRYPGSSRAETAYFMSLNAIFNVSPIYSLDQTDTYYAIDEIKNFIIQYPESKHIEECNSMLDKLNNKLAKKDFEILKLYYNTYSYEATQIMAKNFFKSHPYCPYMAEAMYILVQNNYKYAKNSVANKQADRYQDCIEAFEMLSVNYPKSSYVTEAKKLATDAQKQIDRINSSKNNKVSQQ